MRVLHVIPSVGPLRGGPSAVLRSIARGLADEGVEVDIATTDDNGPGRLDVPLNEPVADSGATYWFFARQTRFYTFSWPLSRWLADHIARYDLIHIHACFSYAGLPAAFYARRHRVPYLVRPLGTLNDWGMKHRRPMLKQMSFRLIEGRILAGAAAVQYSSEQERLEAAPLGISARTFVIPNPVDGRAAAKGQFRARYPELKDKEIILFLSRIDPIKGLDLLLPAFARIRARHPEAALVIAGDGDPAFVDSLRRNTPNVIWTGFLDDESKWAALADAAMLVLPSRSESFGLAATEAMSAGLPVIVTDRAAIHRDVAAAEAGLVIPFDADALAGAISRLAGNAALRGRLGENGRRLAESRYTVKAVTHGLIDAYRELARV